MKEPQDGGGAHEEPKMELEADLKADGSFRKKRGARDKSQKQNKREREAGTQAEKPSPPLTTAGFGQPGLGLALR